MFIVNTKQKYVTRTIDLDDASISILSLLGRNEFIDANEMVKYVWRNDKVILDELRVRKIIKKLYKLGFYIERKADKYRLLESVWIK